MAKAVINLQKESGGIVKISPVDGISITEVTVPESGELATKDYADLKVALTQFTGTNQSLAVNGYQKLPGGLIIQWGKVMVGSSPSGTFTVTMPIAFPSTEIEYRVFVMSDDSAFTTTAERNPRIARMNSSSFLINLGLGSTGGGPSASWLAIGY